MFRRYVSNGVASRGRWALLLALILPFAGCEETLEVVDKEVLTPVGTSTDLLVSGAYRDFNTAYSGGGLTDRYLSSTALITDELYSSGTFPTRTAVDQRAQFPMSDGNTGDAGYVELHQARRASIRAFNALSEDGEGSSSDAAEMKFFEAMTYVALGEGYCSGIPFSEVTPEGDRIDGVPISTDQVFEEAISRFDAALAIDGSLDYAKVGKARALMNLGRYAEAATAVAGVATSMVREIPHNDNSSDQQNPIFNLQSNGRYGMGVSPNDPDPVRDRKDPRMLFMAGGPGFDEGIFKYNALKYSESRNSPVTLADGIEARLIEAEADLAAGGSQWLSILNSLRDDVDNLMAARVFNYSGLLDMATAAGNVVPITGDLVDPGTADGRVDLLFAERAAWLFMTGHRLGDFRRLIRQYGRSPEAVFPTGSYFKGGNYGTDVVLPLDFDEVNNTNYQVSLCSYTTP